MDSFTLSSDMIERMRRLKKEANSTIHLTTFTGHGRVITTERFRISKKRFHFGKIETKEEYDFAVKKMLEWAERWKLGIKPEPKKKPFTNYLDMVSKLGDSNG